MKPAFLLIALLIIAACSSKPHVIEQTDIVVPAAETIYIVNHGWHTGFVVPADTIQTRLPQLKERFGDIPYIEFGWGDKEFYQAEQVNSGLAMQAIFWPTDSVMHTVAVPERPDIYFPESEVKSLCLEPQRYALLLGFIEHSFYKDKHGQIVASTNGLYGNSQFYEGEGDYYLMNTCNKWTAKGLKSAGLDISTSFKLSASSIMNFLSAHANSLPGRSCRPGDLPR